MTPYYEDASVTIWHGDCRQLLPAVAPPSEVALVLTDPPYGVSERTNRASAGRGSEPGNTSSTLKGTKRQAAPANDFPPVFGDDEPFDPSHLMAYRRLVLFGANHYADQLPPSSAWVVWDKIDGLTTERRDVGINDNGDAEMAWSNLGGPVRILRHRWLGMLRSGPEQSQRTLHPTQKPVALMRRLVEWRSQPGDLILDPYMGSGSTLRAAKDCGRRAVGIEYEERYCEVAVRRLAQGSLFEEAG